MIVAIVLSLLIIGVASSCVAVLSAKKQQPIDVGHGSNCECVGCECEREAIKTW